MTDEIEWDYRDRKMAEMHEAICAGDREKKAVEIMQELFPRYGFRSLAEQRNIWPDRVPS